MAVVIASSLRKELSGTPLFDGVSFSVERGDVVALSGPNGAGKTTLLRMITGETNISGGEVAFAKGTRIALHDQRPPLQQGLTLREYALSGAADLIALEDELRALEAAMAGGSHDPATLRRYADAQARLEHAGGWDWRERAASGLRGLGFRDEDFDRQLDTFSGGELTRASLGRALAGDPDLLLLDEPTNHLDVRSLEWLEERLSSLDAAVILVAHDRWFLEAVATAVLELEAGRSLFFRGPWHDWRREKAARTIAAGKAVARHEADIARLERFVARFRASTPEDGEKGAGQADADRAAREGALAVGGRAGLAHEALEVAGLRVPEASAFRPHRHLRGGTERRGGRQAAAPRRDLRDRPRRARRPGRPERLGEDDADRDAAGRGRSATASCRRTSRSRERSSTSAAACSTARSARPGFSGRRRRRCSAASCSPAGRCTRGR